MDVPTGTCCQVLRTGRRFRTRRDHIFFSRFINCSMVLTFFPKLFFFIITHLSGQSPAGIAQSCLIIKWIIRFTAFRTDLHNLRVLHSAYRISECKVMRTRWFVCPTGSSSYTNDIIGVLILDSILNMRSQHVSNVGIN